MIRTILVPASDSETDAVVFETGLAEARPCQAHLEFFHVRLSAGEALVYTPHACFARGRALRSALLKDESENRWQAAQCHVDDFCKRHKIRMTDTPKRLGGVSASWGEEAATQRNRSLPERASMASWWTTHPSERTVAEAAPLPFGWMWSSDADRRG